VVADAKLETQLGLMKDDGTVHTCDACVDGDVDWIADLKVGTTTSYGVIRDTWDLTLLELRGDFPWEEYRKFYVSYRSKGGEEKIECDWGPCPYKGLPYTVQVASTIQNEDIPRSGFVVRAENEDGEVKWELTDEEGIAQLMLQQGTYQLTVEHGFYEHTEQITVSESPLDDMQHLLGKEEQKIDKKIVADIDPEVYVVLCHDKGGGKGSGNPTALLGNIMGRTPYRLIVTESDLSDYETESRLLLAGAKPGDIVVKVWYHEAEANVVSGDGWKNYGLILGFTSIDFGRLLYIPGWVDEATGKEQEGNVGLYWWEWSYNNYFGNNTYINGFNFHDNLNGTEDPPPDITGVEQRCEVNLNLTDVPLYDAAYCVVPDYQLVQQNQMYSTSMGSPGFWGLYNQVGALKNDLVSKAGMYQVYLTAMQQNQDFKLLFP